jgi:hypothetical protein
MKKSDSMGAARANPATIFAFDLLALKGKDPRNLPLRKRKAALQREPRRTSRIVYMQHIGERADASYPRGLQPGPHRPKAQGLGAGRCVSCCEMQETQSGVAGRKPRRSHKGP